MAPYHATRGGDELRHVEEGSHICLRPLLRIELSWLGHCRWARIVSGCRINGYIHTQLWDGTRSRVMSVSGSRAPQGPIITHYACMVDQTTIWVTEDQIESFKWWMTQVQSIRAAKSSHRQQGRILATCESCDALTGDSVGYATIVALNVIVPYPEKEMGMGSNRKMDERRWITLTAGPRMPINVAIWLENLGFTYHSEGTQKALVYPLFPSSLR